MTSTRLRRVALRADTQAERAGVDVDGEPAVRGPSSRSRRRGGPGFAGIAPTEARAIGASVSSSTTIPEMPPAGKSRSIVCVSTSATVIIRIGKRVPPTVDSARTMIRPGSPTIIS